MIASEPSSEACIAISRTISPSSHDYSYSAPIRVRSRRATLSETSLDPYIPSSDLRAGRSGEARADLLDRRLPGHRFRRAKEAQGKRGECIYALYARLVIREIGTLPFSPSYPLRSPDPVSRLLSCSSRKTFFWSNREGKPSKS